LSPAHWIGKLAATVARQLVSLRESPVFAGTPIACLVKIRLLIEDRSLMRVFINYRSHDAVFPALLLDAVLCERLGADNVFRDSRAIELGRDFRPELWGSLARSDVLLVLIGPGWLDARRSDGSRRLDDPQDFVRREIELALRIGIRVIPVLIGNAAMPPANDLPSEIAGLVNRQCLRLRERDGHIDVAWLADRIEEMQPATPKPTAPKPSTPAHRAANGPWTGTVALLEWAYRGETSSDVDYQADLRSAVEMAAATARLDDLVVEERGAGLTLLLPAAVPALRLVVGFVQALDAVLMSRPPGWPRVKVAVQEGTVDRTSSSNAIDRAIRLLSLPVLDDVLHRAGRARLVQVLSEGCFAAVRDAPAAADPAEFLPVTPSGAGRCWLHVPGYPSPPGVTAQSDPAPATTPAPASPSQPHDGAGTVVSGNPQISGGIGIFGTVNNPTVYGGDHVEGDKYTTDARRP
jgi:hypothetical protein